MDSRWTKGPPFLELGGDSDVLGQNVQAASFYPHLFRLSESLASGV